MNIKNIDQWSGWLKVLGHEKRLQIALGLLNKEECDVSTMQKKLGIPQATLSQHLALLKSAGIVAGTRYANRVCYQVTDPKAKQLLNFIKGMS